MGVHKDTLSKNMSKVVLELEYIIGSECENHNAYGHRKQFGKSDFRYPVYFPYGMKFAKTKRKVTESELISPDEINRATAFFMKYRFGKNELYIGRGLIKVLAFLEKRYGIDFEELESQYQQKQGNKDKKVMQKNTDNNLEKKKNTYKVPAEMQSQSIDCLNMDKEIMEYLRNNNFETILDVIERQHDIPHDYCVQIKRKIMFGF